jgi:hypothetical protein
MHKAFVAYMSVFYVADLDYPKQLELPLTILQYIIFKDKKTPADIVTQIDLVWKEYQKFKNN